MTKILTHRALSWNTNCKSSLNFKSYNMYLYFFVTKNSHLLLLTSMFLQNLKLLNAFISYCSLISLSSVQSPHSSKSHSGLTEFQQNKALGSSTVRRTDFEKKKPQTNQKNQTPEVSRVSYKFIELVVLVFITINVLLKRVILF